MTSIASPTETTIDRFAPEDDPRTEILSGGPLPADGRCVLLWVQRTQRARANPAANLAVAIAKDLELPVIAAFCLVPAFPEATLRAYHFMAEGLQALPEAFAKRRIGWVLAVGEPAEVIPEIAERHGAVAVVTDVNPLRIGRQWREQVAQALAVPLVAVDSDTVLPSALFPDEEHAPRTFRPKVLRVRDQYLVRIPNPLPPESSAVREGPNALDAVAQLDLDRSVGPAPDLRGGSAEAEERLQSFIADRLARYDQDRQRADINPSSALSPYLHYGQISPVEIALAIQAADAPCAAKDTFLDELIVHRELSINFTLRNPAYDRFAGLPQWAQDSLRKHQADRRPYTYTPQQFARAATHDRLWNTAQTQLVHEGWMTNRLRMYWAKQIARWSKTPDDALRTTLTLMNRYFVDGREAIGYAQVAWAVGGRHDRPFGPDRPVTGIVRPMGMPAMKRTFDVDAYIAQIEARWGESRDAGEEQGKLDL